MSSTKTYLINDNGDYKIKEHTVKDKSYVLKNTLNDRRTQRKMAQLARMAKENEKNHIQVKKIPEVVSVQIPQKTQHYPQPQPQQIHLPIPIKRVQVTPPPEYEPLMKNYQSNIEEIKKKLHKETDEIVPNGKETKEEEEQRHLFSKICKIIGIQGNPQGKLIAFDTLNNPQVIKELFSLQEKLKEVFPSSKLTALHSNAIDKQQFPGVNIVRQIFKEMGYKLKSINISEGYLGTKKLLRREYQVLKT